MSLSPSLELNTNPMDAFPSQFLMDTLQSSICILDHLGKIVATNSQWHQIGFENNSPGLEVGQNYFNARLESTVTSCTVNEHIVQSIRSVLADRTSCFIYEYPCSESPNARWFELNVTPLTIDLNTYAILNHKDITSEIQVRQLRKNSSIQPADPKNRSSSSDQELADLVHALGESHSIVEYSMNRNIETFNETFSQNFGFAPEELVGQSHQTICVESFIESGRYEELWAKLNRGEFEICDQARCNNSGDELWIQSTYHPVLDASGKLLKVVEYSVDISDRRLLQKELEVASHNAGMAEIATGVLHNVGNVLNSVNVAANLLLDKQKKSPIDKLSKAAIILNENIDNLAEFLTNDSRGRHFPMFLTEFLNFLQENRQTQIDELTGLLNNVEHIKRIISYQQSFGKSHGLIDAQSIVELVEESIELNLTGFQKHNIRIERMYSDVPVIETEKHRVMQILVNLIKNSQEAIRDAKNINNVMTVAIDRVQDKVVVSITDNGIGISEEAAQKLFGHGFTTKKDGHGFGLHSCANAAQSLGGKLSFQSDGLGQGATFTLTLPLKSVTKADAELQAISAD